MKKILVIVGSNKSIEQSNTANLAKELVQNIKVKGEVINAEFISLGEKNIQNCRGCLTCTKSGKCPINDDLEKVKNRMKEADLIILGSPVHISHVSSIYKNFLDRIFLNSTVNPVSMLSPQMAVVNKRQKSI